MLAETPHDTLERNGNGEAEDGVDPTGAPRLCRQEGKCATPPGNTSLWPGCHPAGRAPACFTESNSTNRLCTRRGGGSHCGTILKSKTLEASQRSSTQGGLFMETQESINNNETHQTTTVSNMEEPQEHSGSKKKVVEHTRQDCITHIQKRMNWDDKGRGLATRLL